jgi:hypothetical protein
MHESLEIQIAKKQEHCAAESRTATKLPVKMSEKMRSQKREALF